MRKKNITRLLSAVARQHHAPPTVDQLLVAVSHGYPLWIVRRVHEISQSPNACATYERLWRGYDKHRIGAR